MAWRTNKRFTVCLFLALAALFWEVGPGSAQSNDSTASNRLENYINKLSITPEQQRRTVAELQKLAMSAAETRKQQEALQRKKPEDERHAKRRVYLRTLAADFDRCWQAADERAERGIASAYDDVKRALVDLAEAYTLCASRTDFDRKLAGFMARHGKRGALVKRLADAKLWRKS